jgi:hypothetical protein
MDSIIKNVLIDDFNRLSKNYLYYLKKMKSYPVGSLVSKKRQNHMVYYIVYRKNEKVISDYVQKKNVGYYEELFSKKNNLKKQMGIMKKQISDLEKILKIHRYEVDD